MELKEPKRLDSISENNKMKLGTGLFSAYIENRFPVWLEFQYTHSRKCGKAFSSIVINIMLKMFKKIKGTKFEQFCIASLCEYLKNSKNYTVKTKSIISNAFDEPYFKGMQSEIGKILKK